MAPHQVAHARPLRVLALVCARLFLAHQGARSAGGRGGKGRGHQSGGGRHTEGSSACAVAQPLKPLHGQHQLLPVTVVVANGVQAAARVEAAHDASEPGVVIWPVDAHPAPVGSLASEGGGHCQLRGHHPVSTGCHAPPRAPRQRAQHCLGGGFPAAARWASPPCRFSSPQVVTGPCGRAARSAATGVPLRGASLCFPPATVTTVRRRRRLVLESDIDVSTRTIGIRVIGEQLSSAPPRARRLNAGPPALQRPRSLELMLPSTWLKDADPQEPNQGQVGRRRKAGRSKLGESKRIVRVRPAVATTVLPPAQAEAGWLSSDAAGQP